MYPITTSGNGLTISDSNRTARLKGGQTCKDAKMKRKHQIILISAILAMLSVLAACNSEPDNPVDIEGNTAVVYFSATGNTERIAEIIADETGAAIYEIIPETPYTSEDLNWNTDSSRVDTEHNSYPYDVALSTETSAISLSPYDTIFIGYPLWWGETPSAVVSFLKGKDLSGKTIIPFCTSSSSKFGNSGTTLKNNAGANGTWIDGHRFSSNASDNSVRDWLNSLSF